MAVLVRIPDPAAHPHQGRGRGPGRRVHRHRPDRRARAPVPRPARSACSRTAGELRRFINIYINQEDIRFLQGATTSLKQGDEVSIVPAIAGGR